MMALGLRDESELLGPAATVLNAFAGGKVSSDTTCERLELLVAEGDLEREAFVSLCGEEKTQARIQFMLEKRKPLRN